MSLNILTWNISFGAMTGDIRDTTSMPLPVVCKNKGTFNEVGKKEFTQCLLNVVDTIDESAKSKLYDLSKPYDFVALQEASNWDIIFSKSIELQRMDGFVNHLADLEDMATFYDSSKYTLLAVKVGNLLPGNGRPYQILFLQNKQDNSYYIFINLHNGHKISKEELEEKLSTDLHKGFIPESHQISFGNTFELKDISDIINGKDFKVIVSGDFNDQGRHNYWKELRPFSGTTFVNLKELAVKATAIPPNTCCAPIKLPEVKELYYDKKERSIRRRRSGYDTMLGDYILVSKNLPVIVDNRVLVNFKYDAEEFPTSDHLPVEIILSASTIKSESGSVKYKQKYLKYKQKYLEYKQKYFEL